MKYGTFASDGSIETEADECAVSGRPVLGEHCTLIYVGQGHFVRVLAENKQHVTDEHRAAWLAEAEPAPRSKRAKADEPATEEKP